MTITASKGDVAEVTESPQRATIVEFEDPLSPARGCINEILISLVIWTVVILMLWRWM